MVSSFSPHIPNMSIYQSPQVKNTSELMSEDVKQYLGELISG